MTTEASTPTVAAATKTRVRRRTKRTTSLFSHGEPMIWLTGGALVICLVMITGLLWLVFDRGLVTFWPDPLVQVTTHTGTTYLGEVTQDERYEATPSTFDAMTADDRARAEAEAAANDGTLRRRLLRTGNFDLTGTHFTWVSDYEVASESEPQGAVLVERLSWGRFYGTPTAFVVDGTVEAEGGASAWAAFEARHGESRDRWRERQHIEKHELGAVSRRQSDAARAVRRAELKQGKDSPRVVEARARQAEIDAWAATESARIDGEIKQLRAANAPYELRFDTASGTTVDLPVEDIVRAFAPNRMGFLEKVSVYFSRWWEFLSAEPREANSEGGVWPAIFGTVVMTLIMSILVVPFGVLAALYLREYAKPGPIVSTVRIAINNLAGVPSIVFGVFGLGFFCYIMGVRIDELLFPEYAPNPKFGKGGILWASFTLALLTLPVVIVATEEALAAVPGSMREGSYACGASKWQTIKRIVLPRAMPGIMTGMILAVARGAGEVAPLMLVGAVKLAPELPVDGVFPFVHAERSFMHLGFHIYDLGFQSQNSEAAKPMVFSTTLLLIVIVVLLNALGMIVRARLRRKFGVGV